MSDDPYKAPQDSTTRKAVTNQRLRSAVIYLVHLAGLAAAWWFVEDNYRVYSISAVMLVVLFSNTIWAFVWPVIENDIEDLTEESKAVL